MRQPDIVAEHPRIAGRTKIPQTCGRLADELNCA
jgi:hypothetical protein